MKEVAMELEGLRVVEKHPWIEVDLGSEEIKNLFVVPSNIAFARNPGNTTTIASTTAGFDSMKDQIFSPPLHGGC